MSSFRRRHPPTVAVAMGTFLGLFVCVCATSGTAHRQADAHEAPAITTDHPVPGSAGAMEADDSNAAVDRDTPQGNETSEARGDRRGAAPTDAPGEGGDLPIPPNPGPGKPRFRPDDSLPWGIDVRRFIHGVRGLSQAQGALPPTLRDRVAQWRLQSECAPGVWGVWIYFRFKSRRLYEVEFQLAGDCAQRAESIATEWRGALNRLWGNAEARPRELPAGDVWKKRELTDWLWESGDIHANMRLRTDWPKPELARAMGGRIEAVRALFVTLRAKESLLDKLMKRRRSLVPPAPVVPPNAEGNSQSADNAPPARPPAEALPPDGGRRAANHPDAVPPSSRETGGRTPEDDGRQGKTGDAPRDKASGSARIALAGLFTPPDGAPKDNALNGVQTLLRGTDVAFAGLRGSFVSAMRATLEPRFVRRADAAWAPRLSEIGIRALFGADPAVMGHGELGGRATVNILDKAEIRLVGFGSPLSDARRPAILLAGGRAGDGGGRAGDGGKATAGSGSPPLKIGLLAYLLPSAFEPRAVGMAAAGRGGVAGAPSVGELIGMMQTDVSAIASGADVVIVALHAPRSSSAACPTDDARRAADAALAAGATLVVGMGGGAPGGVMERGRKAVFWSLGDFVAPEAKAEGLVVIVDLNRDGVMSYDVRPLWAGLAPDQSPRPMTGADQKAALDRFQQASGCGR